MFAPKMTSNYVIRKKNSYKLLIFSQCIYEYSSHDGIFGKYEDNQYYLTLKIKDNMFLPELTETNYNILSKLYWLTRLSLKESSISIINLLNTIKI